MTAQNHASGTDRIAEVAQKLQTDIVVNVQGDEPLIDPQTIDRAVNALAEDSEAQMATTWEPIAEVAEVLNPSVVKVSVDKGDYAVDFSRQPIPFPKQTVAEHGSIEAALEAEPALLFSFLKHTGLYAYRREFLLEFANWPRSERERMESLEP